MSRPSLWAVPSTYAQRLVTRATLVIPELARPMPVALPSTYWRIR